MASGRGCELYTGVLERKDVGDDFFLKDIIYELNRRNKPF